MPLRRRKYGRRRSNINNSTTDIFDSPFWRLFETGEREDRPRRNLYTDLFFKVPKARRKKMFYDDDLSGGERFPWMAYAIGFIILGTVLMVGYIVIEKLTDNGEDIELTSAEKFVEDNNPQPTPVVDNVWNDTQEVVDYDMTDKFDYDDAIKEMDDVMDYYDSLYDIDTGDDLNLEDI